jgi:hypothetical protein
VSLTVAGNQLTIAPAVGTSGPFVVDVTVSDGTLSTTGTIRVNVRNLQPPTLGALADQAVTAGGTLTVTPPGSDPNGLPLSYTAAVDTQAYQLKTALGLYLDPGGLYTNYRGQGEVYLRGTSSASHYDNGGGDSWYYIMPDGDLYEFTANYSTPALVGTLVAHLGTAFYDDPTLLTNATPPPPVSLTVAGNQLTVAPAAIASGSFVIDLTAGDGALSTTGTFRVNIQNDQFPTLAPIVDQSVTAGGALTVTLPGSDPDGLPLTYTANVDTRAYQLKTALGLYSDPHGLYTNFRGQGEKYLRGTSSASHYDNGGGDSWYYIMPGGDLYEFTGPYGDSTLDGTFVAHLGTAYYDDPTLLTNATLPAMSLTVSGNRLTIAPAAGSSGSFVVDVTVSDGMLGNSRTFVVKVS